MDGAAKHYVGYEYKEITAEDAMASLLLDGYENFGWELNGNLPEGGMGGRKGGSGTLLRLRRDRKIVNKAELTRLQRNFEACVAEIQVLERRKTSMATVCSLILGIIGTAFMAGSVFAVTARPPLVIPSIVLGALGILGWIFPYFVYRKVKERETDKIVPLIEGKYDEIYEICEKGNKLLY